MVFVEELLEVQDLPACLACEVVGQGLKLVEHDVFYVVVIEDWVEEETVLVRLISTRVCCRLVEKCLASCLGSKVDRLLICAVGHHLSQVLDVVTGEEGVVLT